MKEFLSIFGVLLVGCVGYVYLCNPHAFDKVASVAQAMPVSMMSSPSTGDSVIGGPSLSAARINTILADAGSPAAGTGDDFYNDSAKYQIDDVWAIAFYQHESTFGTRGEARGSLSIGNLRCIYKGYEDLGPWCADGYAHFPSWQAGIEAWYRLIRNVYINQWGYSTVEAIIPHYAPNSDHNDEAGYISSVEQSVASWRSAA